MKQLLAVMNQKILDTFKGVVSLLLCVGRFFRVVDETENRLSIVNLACLVVVIKVALAADPSIADLGGLLIALLAYYGKKQINSKTRSLDAQQNKQLEEVQAKLKDLGDRVGSVAAALGFKNLK